ncbi:MAG: tetratricopeptide repeat protein [Planctomycetia bacterium]
MPTMHNGVGTWYHGKRRIHTMPGACEHCGAHANLKSYDTTLFFTFFYLPLIPLQNKRVLKECSNCRQHRVLPLKQWEASKTSDKAELLAKIQSNPNDRDVVMHAIHLAVVYQDEPLLDLAAGALAANHVGDAEIQDLLGNAFGFFARWSSAEQAYIAALAAKDDKELRERLAYAILKQDRPDDARDLLRHIIEDKKTDEVAMLYVLAEVYQSQGRHQEALEVMDERDAAFPELASEHEYCNQRRKSEQHLEKGKKIKSAFLTDRKAGYEEGNWTARVPHLVPIVLLVGLTSLYLGSAAWIGAARTVYFVNGTTRPYSVVVQGAERSLPPNAATPIPITEGEFDVAFRDARPGLDPIPLKIETPFWTRPFVGRTFVVNPDLSAVVLEEEVFYAAVNPPEGGPPVVHVGEAFYDLPRVDYRFEEFPRELKVKGGREMRKTRVALATGLTPEVRVQLAQDLEKPKRIEWCKRRLAFEPGEVLVLLFLAGLTTPEETIAYVETRLEETPILVEWHRLYQSMMERQRPDVDLKPRYVKLAADTKDAPDALYLLARIAPTPAEADELMKRAAAGESPSGYAHYGLGVRALGEGRFADARTHLEKALQILADKILAEKMYRDVLMAGGAYDRLLEVLKIDEGTPGRGMDSKLAQFRVYAVRGDKAAAEEVAAELLANAPEPLRATFTNTLEAHKRCCENDVDGYLKVMNETDAEESTRFANEFLRGNFKLAGGLVDEKDSNADACHGLLYLQAAAAGDKDSADVYWIALLADLAMGGGEERLFGDVLAGRKPMAEYPLTKLIVGADSKRVLLLVAAERFPAQADEFRSLAKKLNYQYDSTSLCVNRFLKPR